MDDRPIPWQHILEVVLRRQRLIVAAFVAGLGLAVAFAWLQRPTYRAISRIMVTSQRARVTVSPDANDGSRIEHVTDEELNSEVALISSVGLIREVLASDWHTQAERGEAQERGGLVRGVAALIRTIPALPAEVYRRLYGVPRVSPFEKWVQRTAQQLAVNPISKSNLIEVSYADANPQWAAEFVNQLVKHYVDRQARLNQQSDAEGFFKAQQQLLSGKLRAAEDRLRKFYAREHVAPGEDRAVVRNRVSTLQAEFAKAQADLAEDTARIGFLTGEIVKHPRHIRSDASAGQQDPLQLVRTRIVELELQRNALLSTLAPTSIKVQDLDRQLVEARRLLTTMEKNPVQAGLVANPTYQTLELELAQTQAQAAAVRARVDVLHSQVQTDRKTLEHLERIAAAQDRLEQDVATAKSALLTYSKKEEEARFSNALDESRILNVSVVEPAQVPTAPQKWKGPIEISFGATLSLLLGIGLAFVRDRLDPAVKSAAEARELTELPVLGQIPSQERSLSLWATLVRSEQAARD